MEFFFEVVIIGLVLSADSFSAALAMGARPHSFKNSLTFAFSSGGVEAFVSYLGAIAGARLISQFDSIDHWISFLLLAFVALHMIYEGIQELKGDETNIVDKKFHGPFKIIIVSFATSLDAFAVGVGLGVNTKPLLPYLISIGFWAFAATILGMQIAKKTSHKLGAVFTFIGAGILLLLAFKFLIEGL